MQQKINRTVQFEITKGTRDSFERWIEERGLIAERAAEDAERAEAAKARQQSVAEVKKAMAQAGISIDELQGALGDIKPKKSTCSVAPKYQIDDDDGNVVKWTGRGRTPKVFQEYFDQGGSKDDCLIASLQDSD